MIPCCFSVVVIKHYILFRYVYPTERVPTLHQNNRVWFSYMRGTVTPANSSTLVVNKSAPPRPWPCSSPRSRQHESIAPTHRARLTFFVDQEHVGYPSMRRTCRPGRSGLLFGDAVVYVNIIVSTHRLSCPERCSAPPSPLLIKPRPPRP